VVNFREELYCQQGDLIFDPPLRNAQPVKSSQRVSDMIGRSQAKDQACGSTHWLCHNLLYFQNVFELTAIDFHVGAYSFIILHYANKW